jgi:hypothetical protein
VSLAASEDDYWLPVLKSKVHLLQLPKGSQAHSGGPNGAFGKTQRCQISHTLHNALRDHRGTISRGIVMEILEGPAARKRTMDFHLHSLKSMI